MLPSVHTWEYVERPPVTIVSAQTLQRFLAHRRPWVRGVTIAALCLVVGVPLGAILGLAGPIYGSAIILALAALYAMLRSNLICLATLSAIICLLPFAALPVDIGFSPTFLDLVLLVLFFVWFSRIATHRDGEFRADAPTLVVLVFLALAAVSFIAGLSHAALTANVLRHFGEILLSVALFVLVINTVRTQTHLRWTVLALILGGTLAAAFGVVLYYLPSELSVRILSALRVVRYPTGSDVLRYVEDNPELPLRAVSTSVDPNVLGGLLVFIGTLTGAQAAAARPLVKRGWMVSAFLIVLLCLLLTYSRGSFAGLCVALLCLGALRYRKLLWLSLLVIGVLLLLPPAQAYVQRFTEGVQGQDLATQMRMGEYKDALALIQRYPWFGVGFSGTPEIDTYLGVSNVYLLIAEEMGLIGLGTFLIALLVFLARFLANLSHCARDSVIEPLYLGTCLAVVGAMVGGALDHYLFNLDFPHAAALLWLVAGLGTVSIRLAREQRERGAELPAGEFWGRT